MRNKQSSSDRSTQLVLVHSFDNSKSDRRIICVYCDYSPLQLSAVSGSFICCVKINKYSLYLASHMSAELIGFTTMIWSQNKQILLWFKCNKRIKRMEFASIRALQNRRLHLWEPLQFLTNVNVQKKHLHDIYSICQICIFQLLIWCQQVVLLWLSKYETENHTLLYQYGLLILILDCRPPSLFLYCRSCVLPYHLQVIYCTFICISLLL